MQFVALVDYLARLSQTSSRNLMTEVLAELFTEVAKEEIKPVTYLLLGSLGPQYEAKEFNLAEKMVMRALALAYDEPLEAVLKEFKERGDLGDVAEHLAVSKQAVVSEASVGEVFQKLGAISEAQGAGSQEQKVMGLTELLLSLAPVSQKYVIRMVLGRLRLGFSDKTILDALAVMDSGSKAGRVKLEAAYQVFPDIGKIAELVKEVGTVQVAQHVSVEVGVPVIPALAQRLKTAEEMIAKMKKVIVEPKYDGTRVQIHYKRLGEETLLKTYTRNLEETSAMFPELLAGVRQIRAEEIILDSEAVGYDPQTGKMVPFQQTITRKRKHGIEDAQAKVPLKFFVFDVLFKDGESLLEVPLYQRREFLRTIITPGSILMIDPEIVTDDPDTLRRYHALQLAEGLEGVMVKQYASHYEPGRRGWSWVKFKEAETQSGKLTDTIDAVVLGYYRGRGKRTQFGVGAFLVGVRNEKTGRIETIAKIGTGLTDEQWRELKRRLESEISFDKPALYEVPEGLTPDVWTNPQLVVEIAADELTKSPVHTAGVALRFPRLVAFRDDKNLEQATTAEELQRIR